MAENHPLTQSDLQEQLILQVVTTTLQPEFDSYAIAREPVAHWSAIHPEARANYTKTVAIVGGESSGKTTLVHKLANYYGASFALEMGRLYVGTDLGGSEVGCSTAITALFVWIMRKRYAMLKPMQQLRLRSLIRILSPHKRFVKSTKVARILLSLLALMSFA